MGKNSSLVFGVGVNDADYAVKKTIKISGKSILAFHCPYHRKWAHMLMRCYCEKYKARHPTYTNAAVTEEWLIFSKFKAWAECNLNGMPISDLELDKDLIAEGNDEYSPIKCLLVHKKVNGFIVNCSFGKHGKTGYYPHKKSGKFMARCRNPFTGKSEYLGIYQDKEDARRAWLEFKIEMAIQLSNSDLVRCTKTATALRDLKNRAKDGGKKF